MEGMSTQEILNGQDLSTANVDDLLAAMAAGEAQATPAEEAPKPKRGRKKAAEPAPIEDLPNLDEIMANTSADTASPAETAEADAMAAAMAAMADGKRTKVQPKGIMTDEEIEELMTALFE